jgi:hypothetical protein
MSRAPFSPPAAVADLGEFEDFDFDDDTNGLLEADVDAALFSPTAAKVCVRVVSECLGFGIAMMDFSAHFCHCWTIFVYFGRDRSHLILMVELYRIRLN